MVIAILEDLKDLGEALSQLGYKVVILGKYNYPIDAMIYASYIPDISYISSNNIPEEKYGILMINAKGKTINEIDSILKTRLYSPLF